MPFLQDLKYYSTIAGCFYAENIGCTLFLKLPEPLGSIISKQLRETFIPNTALHLINMATRIKFVVHQLVKKCTELQIGKLLDVLLYCICMYICIDVYVY